jgi:hypothetical protein
VLRSTLILAVLSVGFVFTSTGCTDSGPPGPKQLPVFPSGGKVTYQGNPLPNADVSFQHKEGSATATAKTDAQGSFTLSTYGDKDGAPAGAYRVTVAVSAVQEIEPGVLAPEPPGGFKSPIPAQYGNPETSGLTADIPEGGKQDLVIELK